MLDHKTKLRVIVKTDTYGRTLNEFYRNGAWTLNREDADLFTISAADRLIGDLNDYWSSKGQPIRADRELPLKLA